MIQRHEYVICEPIAQHLQHQKHQIMPARCPPAGVPDWTSALRFQEKQFGQPAVQRLLNCVAIQLGGSSGFSSWNLEFWLMVNEKDIFPISLFSAACLHLIMFY